MHAEKHCRDDANTFNSNRREHILSRENIFYGTLCALPRRTVVTSSKGNSD